MDLQVSDGWRSAFPDAHVGVLAMRDVDNGELSEALAAEVERLARAVRQRHTGATRAELAALPTARAYQQHYRAFGQTYHVIGQLESVALKGRPLASPGGSLVTAMFAAEIDHLLLTAGHDVDALQLPLVLDVSRDGDRFVAISGRERELAAGDMVMGDALGIISAVLSGPDQRTRLLPTSRHALFVTYAPAGVGMELLEEHLAHIARLVRLGAEGAAVEQLAVYSSSSSEV